MEQSRPQVNSEQQSVKERVSECARTLARVTSLSSVGSALYSTGHEPNPGEVADLLDVINSITDQVICALDEIEAEVRS